MEKYMMRGFRPLVFLVSLLVLPVINSCGKPERPPEKPQAKAVNPYSSESVFEEVQRKLRENPNDADTLYHLADLYERNAQYAEAIDTYRKVVALKPDMGYAYFKMGTDYDRLNKPAEALTEFKKAMKYLPDYAVLFNNMGVAYGKLDKPQEEIKALKKAIKLRPSYASARYNLGVTFLRVKNKKAAMQEYEALQGFDAGAAEALMKEIRKAE